MAEFVSMGDATVLFLDALKLSKLMNKKNLGVKKAMADATNFEVFYKKFVPTVADANFDGSVFSEFADDANNEQLYDRLSTQGHVATFGVAGAAVGDVAYSYKATLNQFDPIRSDSPESLIMADIAMVVDTPPVIRGYILEDSRTVRTGNFNGAAVNLGTAPAGTKLYGALHVIAGSGGTLTVTIESDDNAGMTSPVTVFSFAALTGLGQEQKSGSSNLQTHYRVAVTITGGTDWQFAVAIGYAK